MGALHHAWAEPGALQLRFLSRSRLQTQPGWKGARLSRQVGQATQAVRVDSRDRVPVRERTLRRRDFDLAGAEADPAAGPAEGRGRVSNQELVLTNRDKILTADIWRVLPVSVTGRQQFSGRDPAIFGRDRGSQPNR